MESFSTEIPPEIISEVRENKITKKLNNIMKLKKKIEDFLGEEEEIPQKKQKGEKDVEKDVKFEDVEKTLLKTLLKDIKPGEKRLIGRITEEIKKAPNMRRLKEISIAIGIIGISTLGITGFILLIKLINEKRNKISS